MSSVVPDGWEAKELGDIATFSGGSAFKEMYQGENSGKHPFIKVSDMNLPENNRYIVQANNWVSEEIRQQAKIKLFPSDSVVFAKVGAALLLNRRRQLVRETAIDNNMMAAIPNTCDHNFLYYSMQRIDLANIVQSGAVPSVNQSQMESIPTITPPLPEQKKIASILTSVDEVIENTQKQIDKLQDLKKATMNELLTKGIGHTEFKDSELGRIPKSWEVVELSSLVNSTRPITYGIVQTGEHIPYGIPCVRVVDIVQGKPILERMIRTTQQINDSYSRTVLQENDIMFALRGNIGFVRKVESFLRGANLTRGIALISNSEEITSDYLLYALQSQVVRRQIADGVNGSALQEIPLGNLRTVKVPVPCKTEQTGISKVIASLDKLIETSLLKLSQTQSLKKSLMQDLLTGKVRVTVN